MGDRAKVETLMQRIADDTLEHSKRVKVERIHLLATLVRSTHFQPAILFLSFFLSFFLTGLCFAVSFFVFGEQAAYDLWNTANNTNGSTAILDLGYPGELLNIYDTLHFDG
tara:strand:+ start:174 stop:506 length:333 start_codon:yes stop_codon:yes gene_type:complete